MNRKGKKECLRLKDALFSLFTPFTRAAGYKMAECKTKVVQLVSHLINMNQLFYLRVARA